MRLGIIPVGCLFGFVPSLVIFILIYKMRCEAAPEKKGANEGSLANSHHFHP
jgi:hypothetical protein